MITDHQRQKRPPPPQPAAGPPQTPPAAVAAAARTGEAAMNPPTRGVGGRSAAAQGIPGASGNSSTGVAVPVQSTRQGVGGGCIRV